MKNDIWKILSPLFLIMLCALNVFAQENQCTLKLSELPDAPELFGLRMGMTTQQVKTRIPAITFGKTNEFGLSRTSISPDFDVRVDKSTFSGVRTISFDFLDGRTTSLWFGYDSSFQSHTVPDFVKQISQSLRLPDVWRPWKTGGQQLSCADFQMTVSYLAEGPSFHITDNQAAETLAARRAAKEDEDEGTNVSGEVRIIADRRTKNYYPPDCSPATGIKTAELVVFKSKEEAESAGYKPGTCHTPREANPQP